MFQQHLCDYDIEVQTLMSCDFLPCRVDSDQIDERYCHISTKTSKPGPVAFCEIEIYSFEVFGTFQLSFAYQSATKAVQSCHKLGINPMGSISRL